MTPNSEDARPTLRPMFSLQGVPQSGTAQKSFNLEEFKTASALTYVQAVNAQGACLPARSVMAAEPTTHQAAALKNTSSTYVSTLLAKGHGAHHRGGAHMRIDGDSLLGYKARDACEQGHGY